MIWITLHHICRACHSVIEPSQNNFMNALSLFNYSLGMLAVQGRRQRSNPELSYHKPRHLHKHADVVSGKAPPKFVPKSQTPFWVSNLLPQNRPAIWPFWHHHLPASQEGLPWWCFHDQNCALGLDVWIPDYWTESSDILWQRKSYFQNNFHFQIKPKMMCAFI